MSSMSYQSPDASQNVELKKGNIASFFKSASAKTAKASTNPSAAADIKSEPHVSTLRADKVKPDVADGDHAGFRASSANLASDFATGNLGHQGKHDESQEDGTGQQEHSQPQSSHQSAGLLTAPEVNDPADNSADKQKPAEGDVLNTDDAGGIGTALLPVSAFVQFQL